MGYAADDTATTGCGRVLLRYSANQGNELSYIWLPNSLQVLCHDGFMAAASHPVNDVSAEPR